MKITLSRKELLASMLFASQDESRYVINGILVEFNPGSKPFMITTDGRRLTVIETVAEQAGAPEDSIKLVMKSDVVKHICGLSKALAGKTGSPWLEFNIAPPAATVVFVDTGVSVSIKDGLFIGAAFPDWRNIVPPKNAPRKPFNDLGLNAEFLGDYAKAAKLLEASSNVVQMNLVGKDDAIEVRLESAPTMYSLIMPCRTQEDVEYQPEFLAIAKAFPTEKKEKSAEADEPTVNITTSSGVTTGEMPLSRFKEAIKRVKSENKGD